MIYTIYFAAWAASADFKAYSPYLIFTTTVLLKEAIKIAEALKVAEPKHSFAIGVAEEHGWYWKEEEGRVDLGLDVA